jgi:hypothetical protein
MLAIQISMASGVGVPQQSRRSSSSADTFNNRKNYRKPLLQRYVIRILLM